MAPLPFILEEFIIKTNEKLNKTNYKIYCNPCIKVLEPSFTCETSSSVSQGSKVVIRSTSFGTPDNYIVQQLSTADMKKFYTLLLRLSLSCGWAFHWVNKPEVEELFNFLNPHLKLPDRRLLAGSILTDTIKDSNILTLKTLQEDQIGVTLTFDGWTNVRNEHLLGIVIFTSEGRPYVWKAIDISSEYETHVEVMEKAKEMIKELNNSNIKVIAVVTDSADPYATSRITEKAIVFLPCFAHQINLCVGEIFKESTEFKQTMDKAIKIASFFRNPNYKFFIVKLKDQQYEEYKRYFTIAAPGETRWNSCYYICTSILKTQKALQILAIKFEPPITETRRRTGEDLFLKREIYEIISFHTFWQYLNHLIEILYPYCKILNKLQSDKARLNEVTHNLAYITQFWNNYSNSTLATRLVTQLEKRWKEWEQPLLLLSCLLHPDYRMKLFNNATINYVIMGSWLIYYYNVWMEKQSKCILKELDNYRLEIYPFNSDTWDQFDGDVYRY
ncbi:hypothetical protein Glove_170g15 [Diversispora epigaea]|uniref:DUF659 domain-containing protein n=1 Tax=Diversispora epigaea TaxID=1348612 RepID=A0A397IXN8_9GLOM|nr:hypothetical protein Glove_170g15 [Diversispora epigaea]